MTGMREDLDRKLHHHQPRSDHPRRSSGETHLPGCPAYSAADPVSAAECNCWPWTDGNAEQPAPASLTLAVETPTRWSHDDGTSCSSPGVTAPYGVCEHERPVTRREVGW